MAEAKPEVSGVIVPVITPVDDQDRVAESDFRKQIRRLLPSGVGALFIGGSAGEGPLLTQNEWVRMMEIAYDEHKVQKGQIPLFGGAMETSTKRIIEKVRILKEIGYRYYVVTPPFYFPMKTASEYLRLIEACKEIDDGMDFIAYNLPGVTGSAMPIEAVTEAAKRGWLTYCKESSANLDYFKRLLAAGREAGLKVFMGDELSILDGLRSGAVGIVPSSANYEPETYVGIWRAAVKGDNAEMERLYQRSMVLRERLPLAGSYWVSGIKYALYCLGIGSGKPISPMEPLTEEQQRSVAEFVKESAKVIG